MKKEYMPSGHSCDLQRKHCLGGKMDQNLNEILKVLGIIKEVLIIVILYRKLIRQPN
jgi:hypothetical protein